MSPSRVEQHLAALTEVFDVTKAVIRTRFSFALDISEIARLLAVDGSRDLIAHGDHREAMFWIAVTYSRCQKVLADDAPRELQDRFDPGYRWLLDDLGITSLTGLRQRSERVNTHLAVVWDVAETIMAVNPGIEE